MLSSDLLPAPCIHWSRALAQRLSDINRYSLKTALRGAWGFVPRCRWLPRIMKKLGCEARNLIQFFLSPPSTLTKRPLCFSLKCHVPVLSGQGEESLYLRLEVFKPCQIGIVLRHTYRMLRASKTPEQVKPCGFSLSKTRLREKDRAVALWDWTRAHVMKDFNKTFLSKIHIQNKWKVGLLLVFFKGEDIKVFAEWISCWRY